MTADARLAAFRRARRARLNKKSSSSTVQAPALVDASAATDEAILEAQRQQALREADRTKGRTSMRATWAGASKIQPNLIAAALIWILGWYTTSKALGEMGMTLGMTWLIGGALQFVFTFCERPIWKRGKWALVGVVVLCADVAFNFGGTWDFTKNIDQTSAWASLVGAANDVASRTAGTAVVEEVAPALAKLIFGILFATAIAAAPEWLASEAD